ncbi:MAG TPA: transketolase C-terminal domain-containing protein [Pyrinomonadaceae bacterium]|jgi:transketolase
MKATRDAFGEALVELGAECENLIVVDADDSLATRTIGFAEHFPERFINVGAAEQNMVGVAAGLAIAGKVALISTHAIFLCGRAYEQIRNAVGYGNLNVKCVGSHGGITVGHDGPTHFSFEDISLMRGIPGMTVIVPCDAVETKKALRALLQHIGPAYLRLGRAPVPVVSKKSSRFEIGRGVVFGEGNDLAIMACGLMVAKSLEAREALTAEGFKVTVANLHSVKPIDRDLIVRLARRCQAIVVAEEHSIYGGLGSAVAEVTSAEFPVPIEFVGLRDTFAESGAPDDLLSAYGLEAADVVAASRKVLRRKLG